MRWQFAVLAVEHDDLTLEVLCEGQLHKRLFPPIKRQRTTRHEGGAVAAGD
jgi:hypothetical protein